MSLDDLLKLKFAPVNLKNYNICFKLSWNIIHMLCWYGRHELLKEILIKCDVPKDLLNSPDEVYFI